jgi:hypothetical protein
VTVLAHMAVGGALGSLVDGRAAPFALGLGSHILLDVIPHYEFEKIWIEAAIVAGVLGTMIATGHGGTGVFWGALGGVLPDIENLLWKQGILPGRWKVFPGHNRRLRRFLPHGRALPTRHAWWQAALVAAGVFVAVRGLLRTEG